MLIETFLPPVRRARGRKDNNKSRNGLRHKQKFLAKKKKEEKFKSMQSICIKHKVIAKKSSTCFMALRLLQTNRRKFSYFKILIRKNSD